MSAIDGKYADASAYGDFDLADELSRIANVAVPPAVEEIRTASVVHETQCDVDKMKETVRGFLKL